MNPLLLLIAIVLAIVAVKLLKGIMKFLVFTGAVAVVAYFIYGMLA